MNRREQKERIKEIIQDIEIKLGDLDTASKTLEETFNKVDELDDVIGSVIGDYSEYFEAEEIKSNILNSYIEDNIDIESIKDDINDFNSELEEYKEDLSDSRREALEEIYVGLETILEDYLEIDIVGDGLTIEDVIERLTDTLNELKSMK